MACYYLWLQSGWLAQASLAEAFGAIWGLVLWGYVFGGIPALLTGLLAMRLRLHRTAKGVVCAVVAGAVLSLLWFVVINWHFCPNRSHNKSGIHTRLTGYLKA